MPYLADEEEIEEEDRLVNELAVVATDVEPVAALAPFLWPVMRS